MRAVSLFSGAAGLDFGARSAGAEISFANDKLAESEEVFGRYFPTTDFALGPIEKQETFPRAELLLGGYPCQSFSMGGARKPMSDPRTNLYQHYARVLDSIEPDFFLAENVPGLRGLDARRWLWNQYDRLSMAGRRGYNVSVALLNAEGYGVSQKRRRVFFVGVNKRLKSWYHFPRPTHRRVGERDTSLPLAPGHGELLRKMPLWPVGEFYSRTNDEGVEIWPWYYMSRNRKAKWDGPSYTILANGRHVTLHPASPIMTKTWEDLADGWKQRWDFADEYEHLSNGTDRPTLEIPRRLSWRECAVLQTLPSDFQLGGSLMRKYELVGNAVPPLLAHCLLAPLIDGTALSKRAPDQSDLFAPAKARRDTRGEPRGLARAYD